MSARLLKVASVTGSKSTQGCGHKSDNTMGRVIESCGQIKIKGLQQVVLQNEL